MNKYSFKDFLEKEVIIDSEDNKSVIFAKIEIPRIQRDYAQGRENESEIRKRFLDSIFNVLGAVDDKSLEMDFVYGSVAEIEDKKAKQFIYKFIPLDGQQRLTTLFLLYWYIGSREIAGNEIEFTALKELLKKFTYETRVSSRRFCTNLVNSKLDFKKTPHEEIQNLSWFYKSYKKDPTIKSMLKMLDDIHERYGDKKQFYSNLQKLQFYILPLNGFNLTDELYVKMNARGKQLTNFENLKADFIKWMKAEDNPFAMDYERMVTIKDRTVPYYLLISQKLDNEWTHFFWERTGEFDLKAKDKQGSLLYPDGRLVDPLFFRLFYRYFLNIYIIQTITEDKNSDKESEFQELYIGKKYQNFDAFDKILSRENLLPAFEKFLDSLILNWKSIEDAIQPSWREENKLWTFFDKDFPQSDRVIFLAISLFLEKNDFDTKLFRQWMRIVWNIVQNTDIPDIKSMRSVMKLINELSDNAFRIYDYLADDNNNIKSDAAKNAVSEERWKVKFISQDKEWENVFIMVEKHPFYKGSVGFIMTEKMEKELFIHRSEMASFVFDSRGVNQKYQNEGHIFLRALISKFVDSSLIGQNFTDVDEGEHYLKKMLASNETVRDATREWFSLNDENELNEKLKLEISKHSQIQGWNTYDQWEKKRISRAHEALYLTPDLQNWMQWKEAFRFAWNQSHLWVSRPRSWYDWVMLDSNRNEIITEILKKGFTTGYQISYPENEHSVNIDYYWSNNKIEVFGKVDNYNLRLTFDNNRSLKVDFDSTEGWKEIKIYDYVQADELGENLLEVLTNEVFNQIELKKSIAEIETV